MNDPSQPAGLRVLIADDHEMILGMFVVFLSQAAGMQVATACTLGEAETLVQAQGPFDVVLLDLNMPGMDGVAGLRRVIKHNQGRPVAILTGNLSARMQDEIMQSGAAGIVLKTSAARSIANAIQFMHAGEVYLPMQLMRPAPVAGLDARNGKLTEKEQAVLVCLIEGQQNKEIARVLQLAEPTIKMHVTAICRKLGAKNRTQAVVIARDLGVG